jgi:hypothetical protein
MALSIYIYYTVDVDCGDSLFSSSIIFVMGVSDLDPNSFRIGGIARSSTGRYQTDLQMRIFCQNEIFHSGYLHMKHRKIGLQCLCCSLILTW